MKLNLKCFGVLCVLAISASLGVKATAGNKKAKPSFVKGYTISSVSDRWVYHTYELMTEKQITAVFRSRIPSLSHLQAYKLAEHLYRLARQYDFDPAVILSVIEVESAFRIRAISPVGARGLMQIMPKTGVWIADQLGAQYRGTKDLYDPFLNIRFGTYYLGFLRDRYESNFSRFLAAYNAGPGTVDKLVRRNQFRPRVTKVYIERIRERVPSFRRFAARYEERG